jgi:hypothetical protein
MLDAIKSIVRIIVIACSVYILYFLLNAYIEAYIARIDYEKAKAKYDGVMGTKLLIDGDTLTIIDYIPCSETFVLDNGSRISANPEYITLHYKYNGVDSTKMIK